MIHPKLKLSQKSDGKLAEFASQCINSIGENAAAFVKMAPTLAELTTAYTNFTEALENCGRSGNPANTAAKNQARETLGNMLTWCASSCSEIAGDDVALFELSGFSTRAKPTKITSINCPEGINVSFGPVEGTVYCAFESVQHARCYEIQYGATPTALSSEMTVSSSRRILVTDFTPMSKGYLRIRTVGPRNIISDWSTVIEFKVI